MSLTIENSTDLSKSKDETPIDRVALLDRCNDLAKKQSILFELGKHIEEHGFAGSTLIPKLIFLTTITRMFDKPVSAVIKGTSSSGKSFALKTALRYVPSSAYEEFNGLSEKALLYRGSKDFKNKHLVIGEVAGLTDGSGRTFLRQLISEGHVRYATVQSTKNGHEGKELNIEGPMGALMTTTESALHWEDETRLLSLQVDQSPEQVRRLLFAQSNGGPREPSKEDLSRWHALHDYVCYSNLKVKIPYDKILLEKIPFSDGRAVRDAAQILSLIRAHALLHQDSREKIEGYVIANIFDYYIVHGLIETAIDEGLRASVPRHIRNIVEAVLAQYSQSKRPVSMTELSRLVGKDPASISRNVKVAEKHGYLENLTPGQGRVATLVPGQIELPSGSALPSPRELSEALGLYSNAPTTEEKSQISQISPPGW